MRWFALIVCFVVTSNVFAVDRTVSSIHVDLEEWELVPTMVGTKVESFVGLRNTSNVIGSNITSVWFLRSNDSQWQVFAWHEQSKIKSIAHVKSTLGLADSTDVNWPDATAQQGVDPSLAVQPDSFAIGVFENDPFVGVIDSLPDPGVFIDMLTDTGWSAATISIQIGDSPCSQDEILSTLAAMVEADIATGANGAIAGSFSIPQTKCDEWRSMTLPLDENGEWSAIDYREYVEVNDLVNPVGAWQSVAPNTLYSGQQTVVVSAGGVNEINEPYVSTNFVLTLEDQTPPTLSVTYLGNGAEALRSPGGLSYFKSPITITVDVNTTDNIDDPSTLDSNLEVHIDANEVTDQLVITEPGYYTLRVSSSDSSGNFAYFSELIEVRSRFNHLAHAGIESIAVTSLTPATDLVQATVLVTANQFDPCDINLSRLALWLTDSNNQKIGAKLIRMSPGYEVNGQYDSAMVEFDQCTWRLSMQGEVPAGSLTNQAVDFSVTGSGLHTNPEAFDFITQKTSFIADANAQANLISTVNPTCECSSLPPVAALQPCEWTSQFTPLEPEVVAIDHWDSCIGIDCAYTQLSVIAVPDSISGSAVAEESCGPACGLGQYEDEVAASGGVLSVWLEGEDCCPDCEILVEAAPIFNASALIDPRATAGAVGLLGVNIPGCDYILAQGGAAVSSNLTGTIGIPTPSGGVVVPYSNLTQQTVTISEVSNCIPARQCDMLITITTRIRLRVIADSTMLWRAGKATATIWGAALRVNVFPKVSHICGDEPVIGDERRIYFDAGYSTP